MKKLTLNPGVFLAYFSDFTNPLSLTSLGSLASLMPSGLQAYPAAAAAAAAG